MKGSFATRQEALSAAEVGEIVMVRDTFKWRNEAWCVMTEDEANHEYTQGWFQKWTMWQQKKESDMTGFENTMKALAEWDAGEPARQMAWNKVETGEDVAACQAADAAALALVQNAFYQDTHHINAMDHCRLVGIEDIRKMVKGNG